MYAVERSSTQMSSHFKNQLRHKLTLKFTGMQEGEWRASKSLIIRNQPTISGLILIILVLVVGV
jgi:hypothetical protein